MATRLIANYINTWGRTVRHLIATLVSLAVVSHVSAGDLCKENSFTKAQAMKGRWSFDSSCGLCHLYNLSGRVPGQSASETPNIAALNDVYLKALDGNGGMTPSLVSPSFFKKWKDQKAFADRISNATGAFPPTKYVKNESEIQIAAYILFERCGKL
jgi:cytochrome c5